MNAIQFKRTSALARVTQAIVRKRAPKTDDLRLVIDDLLEHVVRWETVTRLR